MTPLTIARRPIRLALSALLLVAFGCVSCRQGAGPLFSSDDEAVVVSPLAKRLGFSKDRPLVMGMNTSYAPLQYVDDEGAPRGYDVEFTKKLMKRMGIPFTFAPNHWDKMSPGIIGGKYDMGMLVYSSYRKDVTNYSNAVFRLYYQILYRKKDYTNFDFRHLKGKKIAYMKSRPIGRMLTSEEAEGQYVTDLGEAIVDLAKGKYDGVICYRFQAKYFTGINHLEDQLQADELSLEPREYCYASHDKRLIDAINAELARMEADGTIDEVYGKEVAERFGAIRIPLWVWLLLAGLTVVFLLVFSINSYLYNKRLKKANDSLQAAYREMTEKNAQLKVANARAEESTRMKSAFIQQISHEIRTPLNVLSGFTQVLTTPGVQLDEAQQADISNRINESTDRITGLVNKMLELSEVASEAVIERNDETTAQMLADQAIMMSGIAEAGHLVFETHYEGDVSQTLHTHQRFAARVLELLLDNARKFTRPAENYLSASDKPQAKEHVSLTVAQEAGLMRFVVEDTGIGIPDSEAEHIFDEFVQLDEYYDGTGIGLAVARSLARRLGGDIVLDMSYHEGARFVFTLPAD